MSIILHNANQRCNILQSVIGVYIHTANTPEDVVDIMARLGVSISSSSINAAISSLSADATQEILKVAMTGTMMFGWDNFDVQLKPLVPRIEDPQNNMLNMTSGTFIPLREGYNPMDMDCAEEVYRSMWYSSQLKSGPDPVNYRTLLEIHTEPTRNDSRELTWREQYALFKVLETLVEWGGPFFARYTDQLEKSRPDPLEQIPVVKTTQRPLRATNDKQSTKQGNIDAIMNFWQQCGYGQPAENPGLKELGDRVSIGHGDLNSLALAESAQEARSEEEEATLRLQNLVVPPGIYHARMAAADALRRIFILNSAHRDAKVGLYSYIKELRPKQFGIFASNNSGPVFRDMNDAAIHVSIVLRLNAWQDVAVNEGWRDLDALARSEPAWSEIERMAYKVVRKVIPVDDTLDESREQDEGERDVDWENTLLLGRMLLLYEELVDSSHSGDIGAVESCLIQWIPIWRSCGKHKYSHYMSQFLFNLHHKWPPKFR
jgi:hypothetical protein